VEKCKNKLIIIVLYYLMLLCIDCFVIAVVSICIQLVLINISVTLGSIILLQCHCKR